MQADGALTRARLDEQLGPETGASLRWQMGPDLFMSPSVATGQSPESDIVKLATEFTD